MRVQASAVCREKLVREGGLNDILMALAPYHKQKQPLKEAEETEYVLELANALAACLVDAAARSRFEEDEGVELMLLILKSRQLYRLGALKVRSGIWFVCGCGNVVAFCLSCLVACWPL